MSNNNPAPKNKIEQDTKVSSADDPTKIREKTISKLADEALKDVVGGHGGGAGAGKIVIEGGIVINGV